MFHINKIEIYILMFINDDEFLDVVLKIFTVNNYILVECWINIPVFVRCNIISTYRYVSVVWDYCISLNILNKVPWPQLYVSSSEGQEHVINRRRNYILKCLYSEAPPPCDTSLVTVSYTIMYVVFPKSVVIYGFTQSMNEDNEILWQQLEWFQYLKTVTQFNRLTFYCNERNV